jgi:hypothetical protein
MSIGCRGRLPSFFTIGQGRLRHLLTEQGVEQPQSRFTIASLCLSELPQLQGRCTRVWLQEIGGLGLTISSPPLDLQLGLSTSNNHSAETSPLDCLCLQRARVLLQREPGGRRKASAKQLNSPTLGPNNLLSRMIPTFALLIVLKSIDHDRLGRTSLSARQTILRYTLLHSRKGRLC